MSINLYHKSTSEYSKKIYTRIFQKKSTPEYFKIFKLIMYFYAITFHMHIVIKQIQIMIAHSDAPASKKNIGCHISTSSHVYCINIMVVKT
jgi:hypothetical protein